MAIIRPDGSAVQPAPSGTIVRTGDEIRTLSATGALITFFVGTEIELGAETILVVDRISRQGERVDVSLKQVFGATLNRVQALTDPASAYRIEAGGAVAVVRGTTFSLLGPFPTARGNVVVLVCLEDCDHLTTFAGVSLAPFTGFFVEVDGGACAGWNVHLGTGSRVAHEAFAPPTCWEAPDEAVGIAFTDEGQGRSTVCQVDTAAVASTVTQDIDSAWACSYGILEELGEVGGNPHGPCNIVEFDNLTCSKTYDPRFPGGHEMIVGMTNDAQFGPAILVGLGGIFVEVFKDTAVGIPPLTEGDAQTMLQSLRGHALLQGTRGQPAADIAGLVKQASERSGGRPVVLACASMGSFICWGVSRDASAVAALGGMMVMGGVSDPDFTAEYTRVPDAPAWDVTVRYIGKPTRHGPVNATVKLATDVPSQPFVLVRLSGKL